MNTPSLNEEKIWTGHWWLPEAPDNPVSGVLKFDPTSGLSLSLIGGFENRVTKQISSDSWAVLDESRTWDVILGAAGNKAITLLDCYPVNSKFHGLGFDGPAEQTVGARVAFVGLHFESEDAPIFTRCEVAIENLTDWSAESVLSATIVIEEGEKLDGRGSIQVEPVEEHVATVNGMTVRLIRAHPSPYFEHLRGCTIGRMTDTATLRFDSDEPLPYSGFSQAVRAMQDLLSLATHQAAAVLWLKMTMLAEACEQPEDRPVQPRSVGVYRKEIVQGNPVAKAAESHQVLFTLRDVSFETFIPRWLEVRDQFAATCNMILGLRYVPGGYVQTQLVTAVAAAEAMGRALNPSPPIPADEFKVLKKKLMANVPEQWKSWLSGLLARNEPSLRMRLLHLASRPDSSVMEQLLPDPAAWAKAATNARNDLTHSGQSSRHALEELYAAVRVTNAVVVINLLHEIGVPVERQREILTLNSDLRHATKLGRRHFPPQNAKGNSEVDSGR